MPITIDDSAFPAPGDLPNFSQLVEGDVFRLDDGVYRLKINSSAAFNLNTNSVESVSGDPNVQNVTATLVITAP